MTCELDSFGCGCSPILQYYCRIVNSALGSETGNFLRFSKIKLFVNSQVSCCSMELWI